MFGRSKLVGLAVLVLVLSLAIPEASVAKGPKGGGGGETTATNNLSWPVIAVDGFGITALTGDPTFTVPYAGEYDGLTAEEIAYLQANGPWYPQQTEGNEWQADFTSAEGTVDVTYIDWSDNMEAVSPKVRTPFRLELVLFKSVETAMSAYTMKLLENPSSKDELQGTNNTRYDQYYPTVISGQPQLIVQYLGVSVPETLTWGGTQWTEAGAPVDAGGFAPELNVGGRYIFGASTGGWKPAVVGFYRITFYVPDGSNVNLATAAIANEATGWTYDTSEGVAAAELDTVNNLTYIDVKVVAGGSRKPK